MSRSVTGHRALAPTPPKRYRTRMSKTRFVTVSTTVAKATQVRRIARSILDAHLAACVQWWPLHSLYRWKGKLESSREFVLACKTRSSLAAALTRHLRLHHPYEVPEIIVTPILTGLPSYLAWITEETIPTSDGRQPRLTFSPPPTKKLPSRKNRNV